MRIRRHRILRGDDVDDCGSVLQAALDRTFEIARVFDPFAMRPKRAGHGGIVGMPESGAHDPAPIVDLLIVALDVPGCIV